MHLVVAGGYDDNVKENLEYYQELCDLAKELAVEDRITFLKSQSDERKQLLMHSCACIIYTPQNEHFGIVPLEAMYMKRPVIATNTGGPKESVRNYLPLHQNKSGIFLFYCNDHK